MTRARLTMSLLRGFWYWLSEVVYPWSSLRTATTSKSPIAQTMRVSSGLSPSDLTRTTLSSPETVSMSQTTDGSVSVTVRLGLREAWKDWEISSVDTRL